jgi:hypothetical protein
LRGTDIRLHLFGLKGVGAAELRHHPRVATVDSLLEAGEIDWKQLHDESVLAFACEDDEAEASSRPELALAA